jgi:hypothetical protein
VLLERAGRGDQPIVGRHLTVCHSALLQELLSVKGVECPQVVDDVDQLCEDGLSIWLLRIQAVLQHHFKLRLHLLYELWISQTGPICCDDDHGAEESDLSIAETEPVYSLCEFEDTVHEEPCVTGGHSTDGISLDHVPVQADKGL